MPRSPVPRARYRGAGLDGWARAVARRRSLQDLDVWARRAGMVLPPVRDYREIRTIAVTGAEPGLESYASHAVSGRAKPDALWAALDHYAEGEFATAATTLRHLHHRRAQRLAWLLLQLHDRDQVLVRAASLILWLVEQGGQRSLTATTRGVLLEALLLLGRRDEAARVLNEGPVPEDLRVRAETDLANPDIGGADHDQWLERINASMVSEGCAPVTIADADTPYLGLRAEASPVASDTLVTVVISSYRPDSTLLHAVRSVLRSSWTELEVLVVDDASGPAHAALYGQAREMDERVRVHTMKVNGGTYAIRNWALEHASGEFITFHDSDDWMHSDRIAVQMDFLRSHPASVACVTPSMRVTQQLELVNRRSLGSKLCEPSLLFDRVAVTDRLGGFDAVRKAGDAEFRQRLEKAYGAPVPVVGNAPLTLQLISDTSLSGGDISRYTVSMPRRIYRACYERWHAARSAQGLSLRLDSLAGVPREFYAPDQLRGVVGQPSVDVTVTADLLDARRRSPTKDAMSETRRAVAAGSTVGVRHKSGPWHRGRMSVNVPRELIAMLNAGHVVMLPSEHEV